MFKNAEELLKYIRENEVDMLDLKVIDLVGRWRHMTYSTKHLDERLFTEGGGISLSPYPGYRSVERSDMKVIPDPTTAFRDPFFDVETLSVICNIMTEEGDPYIRDPRAIAKRAEAAIAKEGIDACSQWLPELEFYIFDDVKYGSASNKAFYKIDCEWAYWNAEADQKPNLGVKLSPLGMGQCDAPRDRLQNLRTKMVRRIEAAGYSVKYHHHEVGGMGQCEIEPHFDNFIHAADGIMVMKYIIINTAREMGKAATFMPKPLHDSPGNGLHFHQYFKKDGKSLFYDPTGYAGLSEMAIHYIGGLCRHTPAIMAITNPGTNSYRRFGVGMAAPMNLFFSQSNRSASIRIPGYSINEIDQRVEYRMGDALCNPYLAMAVQLLAGLDGIRNKIDPTAEGFGPYDFNNYTLSTEERANIKSSPVTLEEALAGLEGDSDFLTRDGVFPPEVIETWIKLKQNDLALVKSRPHPVEYELYFDM